jgi:uncharacterized membrane protein
MPLGLGPFLDQIVTLFLLIAAAIGGMRLYKKYERPPLLTQTQAESGATPCNGVVAAEEILRERYARGEIDRAQYLQMLQNLKAQSGGRSAKRPGSFSAEGIVRERYVRGDINHTQFQEMIGDLREDR